MSTSSELRGKKTALSRKVGYVKGILGGVLVRVTKYRDVDSSYVEDRLKEAIRVLDELLELIHGD